MPKPHVIDADWYDHPEFYDFALSDDTAREADFIEAACKKYCPFPAKRLLEPACGTGRLVVEMAKRGYRMTGFDISKPMLGFLKQRLNKLGLRASVFHGNMAGFELPQPVDAAFCTFNTFRHLLTEEAAHGHLESVASALRPGGIYILGLHLLPMDIEPLSGERWVVERGRRKVTVSLRVTASDRRKRIESLALSMRVRDGKKDFRLRDRFDFRMYTAAQFRKLLRGTPTLKLRDVYDFWYDVDDPRKLDDEITDTVFILQRC